MEAEQRSGYTADEVHAIVRRALLMHDPAEAVSHEELEDIARQSGISPERLREAIAAERRDRERETARENVLAKKRREFRDHLRSYLITNAFLMLVNLLTSGYLWFLWVAGSWGIGLAFHACDVFFPNEDTTEKEVDRALPKAKKKGGWDVEENGMVVNMRGEIR